MKNKVWIKVAAVIGIAIALAIIPVLGACAPTSAPPPGAPKPPVEKPPLRVAYLDPLTGRAAWIGMALHDAMDDYFKWVNETKGGIKGHKLEFIFYDYMYEAPKAVEGYKFLMGKKPHVFLAGGALGVATVKPLMEKDNVPGIVGSADISAAWPPTVMYGCVPTYSDQFAAFLKWAKENWKETRPMRVAVLYADDPAGRAFLLCKDYAKSLGIEWVAEEPTTFLPLDLTAELSRIKPKNPDYIYCGLIAPPTATALKTADRLGMKVPMVGCSQNPPAGVLAHAGTMAADMFYCAMPFPTMADVDIPGIKQTIELYQKYHKTTAVPIDEANYFTIAARIVVKSLELALEAVPYEQLTLEAVRVHGFNKIKDFNPDGLCAPITYEAGVDQRGNRSSKIYKVVMRPGLAGTLAGAETKSMSDWIVPPAIKPK